MSTTRSILQAALVAAALAYGGSSAVAAHAGASNAQTPDAAGIRSVTDVCEWDKMDWHDMTGLERNTWEALGWTRERWDSDNQLMAPLSSYQDWNDLTIPERQAAVTLGYVAQTWEDKICQ